MNRELGTAAVACPSCKKALQIQTMPDGGVLTPACQCAGQEATAPAPAKKDKAVDDEGDD